MQARNTLTIAALAGFLGVALGAFGAHGLKAIVPPDLMTVYQTGVQYHLVHAVVLLGLGVWQLHGNSVWLQRSAVLFVAGLLLFSGSLYLLAITGIRPLGMITPLGGTAWLVAWWCLLMAARQQANTPKNLS